MNILKLIFRDKQEISTDIFECWEVRWCSRHGEFHGDTIPQLRAFPRETDAIEFKQALDDAFALVKTTSGTRVTIEKQES